MICFIFDISRKVGNLQGQMKGSISP